MLNRITIQAPATIANLVCGFDVLGLALKDPADIMRVALTREVGIRITHEDNFGLPTIPEQNVAGVSLLEMLGEVTSRAKPEENLLVPHIPHPFSYFSFPGKSIL